MDWFGLDLSELKVTYSRRPRVVLCCKIHHMPSRSSYAVVGHVGGEGRHGVVARSRRFLKNVMRERREEQQPASRTPVEEVKL